MPEQENASSAETQNAETANAAVTDKGKVDAAKVEDLPKWAQDELSRARNDAASYRTKLRTTEDSLKSTQDQLKEVTDKVADTEVKLHETELTGLKLEAALQVGVPGEHLKAFADRLRGSTAEELLVDAEAAKSMFGVGTSSNGRATDPSAGLGNSTGKKTPEDAWQDLFTKRLGR